MMRNNLRNKIKQSMNHFQILHTLKREEGLTLIELLVVVAILGIIAAIAIPSISGAMTNSKISATETTMSTIQEALQRYEIDNGKYPTSLFDLTHSTTSNNTTYGPYLDVQSFNDGWSTAMYYGTTPHAHGYLLVSSEGNGNSTNSSVIEAEGGTAGGMTPTPEKNLTNTSIPLTQQN